MATDLVIILSSDWVASTAMRAQLGEERADALQELHDTLLRRVIDGAGGSVVKHSGDGVLAIFRSATSALGAAVEIQNQFAGYRGSAEAVAPVNVRVGLAAGDVKHQTGDIFGMPVIEAVRLQSAAQPNEILCSDLVRILSQGRGSFEFEDAGRLELKGLPKPVQALRVRGHETSVAAAASPAPARSTPAARTTVASSRARAALLGALGIVVAATVLVAADPLGWRTTPPVASVAAASAATTRPENAPPPNSIAVLPLSNLSPNESDAYFAVGIHEEILSQLAKLGSLHVVSRTTVSRYAGTDKTIPEIARELNVETVMEGSVRYADGRVLVTAQLIDGAADAHLWSDSYEREFSNIFAIQAEIALNVARAMQAELLPEERERIERVPTTSLAAYELYLSASAFTRQQTREGHLLALEQINRALELDPRFVLAWVRKANISTVAPFVDPQRTGEHLAAGEQAARRALELDPENGPANAALGFLLFQTQDWSGSERAFRKAIEANEPLGSMSAYSVLQLAVGNFGYAREILEEVRVAEPQNPTALGFLVLSHALLGDWSSAVAQYELGTQVFMPWNGGSIVMLHLSLARGEYAEARRVPPEGPVSTIMMEYLEVPADALRELRRMSNDPAFADPVSQRIIALWAALLDDSALALTAMRSAARQGGNVLYLWYPQFRETRQLPEFKQLVRDLGLVAYWQEFGWQSVCRPLGSDDFQCN